MPGFVTKRAAEQYADDQEARIRDGRYIDPKAGQITVSEWVNLWFKGLDLEWSTMENYAYYLQRYALPAFGNRSLASIAPEEVESWERDIVRDLRKSKKTAGTARTVLGVALGAAVPSRIQLNPAARKRATGKKADRRVEKIMEKRREWATPLEVLLMAERIATLSGHQSDFVMTVFIGWTGARWSEAVGLRPPFLQKEHVDFDWKLYELDGYFYFGPPKDGSIRAADLPPFLRRLLDRHREDQAITRCTCLKDAEEPYCSGGEFLFLGPAGGHPRRSDFARRFFRPAADGWYPEEGGKAARPAMPVLADVTASWPGVPLVGAVPAAGEPYEVASGMRRRPVKLPVNSRSSRADLVAYAVAQGMPGEEARLLGRDQLLDRYVRPAAPEAVAAWMPVMKDLTPHGLRHSMETWMAEDGIAEALRDERMGHIGDGSMRSHYTHVSEGMRGKLVGALEERWERALAGRAELERAWAGRGLPARSSVPLLEELLVPYRENVTPITQALSARGLRRAPRARSTPILRPKTDIGRNGRGRSQAGNGL
ncbi:hypothetical protein JOL79_11710 [Microbispora sp. RL4-1S]|uniref:Integrase n=1 Tax=Microbispora oryzae TaxID=2806554 RepID=A0A940WNX8_9ACTN|nr:hypothetical protein [Microbispora oryzae]MBP2704481.1 hypothetical protein [Microbispora oryzae]